LILLKHSCLAREGYELVFCSSILPKDQQKQILKNLEAAAKLERNKIAPNTNPNQNLLTVNAMVVF